MTSVEEDPVLIGVDATSAVGGLMRRYWLPFLPVADLDKNPVLPVRLLGEGLVCYRDLSGTVGLIGDLCGHDLVNMKWGYPDDRGLRCCYHHWCYDETGQCTEMPFERSLRAEDEHIAGYPVREQGGLLFAYLGADPAPRLPSFDLFSAPEGARSITYSVIAESWLRCQESSPPWAEGAAADTEDGPEGERAESRPLRRGRSSEGVEWQSELVFPSYTRVDSEPRSELWIHVPMNRKNTLRLVYAVDRRQSDRAGTGSSTAKLMAESPEGDSLETYIAALDLISAYSRIVQSSPPDDDELLSAGNAWFGELLTGEIATMAAGDDPLNLERATGAGGPV